MKKVTNATLGGIVFAVEEDAFDALSQYLKSIETKFANSPDYSEIANDIESAIAEKFKLRKKDEKKAVTIVDVNEVVGEMGTADEVSEVADDVKGEDTASEPNTASQTNDSSLKKRLYRNTDDSVMAGVASGIAQYFDIDPVIVRVLFVVATFFSGFGLLVYIILWMIVPAAKTTADKYAMRGEGMTVADITERVKKNLNNEEHIEKAKGLWGSLRGLLVRIFSFVRALLRGSVYIFRYIFGTIIIIASTIAVMAVVVITSLFWMPKSSLLSPAIHQMVGNILQDGMGILFVISCVLVLLIPLVVIIMLGASLFAGKNIFTMTKSISMFVVWVVSIAIVSSYAINYGPKLIKNINEVSPEFFNDNFGHVEVVWEDDNVSISNNQNESGSGINVHSDITVHKDLEELNLSGQNLSGSLKAEIRRISNLRILNLSDNEFTGLPAEVGQLSRLEILVLKNNKLTGLPHELGNLKSLKYLDVSGNNISMTDITIIKDKLPEVVIVLE